MTDYQLNLGIHALNVPDRHKPRTAVVLGIPRSGTTMVAGTLFHLGVDMGDRLTETYEDLPLSRAVEKEHVDEARRIISERNARTDLWGWKRPSSRKHLDTVKAEFRNPYFLTVFRDPLAVSTRKHVSVGQDVMWSLERNVRAQKQLIDVAKKVDAPLLLLSYEKCLHHPHEAVEAVASFVGVAPTDEAVAFIQPDARV